MSTSKKSSLLLVLSRDISVSSGGRETLLINFIQRLSRLATLHCLYFDNSQTKSFIETNKEAHYKALGFASSRALRRPSAISVTANMLCGLGTLQESLFFSKESSQIINSTAELYEVNAVYFDMIRLFRYAKEQRKLNRKIIFDLDDLLSDRYRQFHLNSTDVENATGTYANIFSSTGYKTVLSRLGKYIFCYESLMCRKRENDLANIADAILLTSPAEALEYENRTKHKHIYSNFPIVSVRYSPQSNSGLSSQLHPSLVWLGNNLVPHNASALRRLLQEIIPAFPNMILTIAGKTPADIEAQYSTLPNVNFLGFVDNVDEILTPEKILVAPFLFGTGIKIKILEAMASGVTVVSNQIGLQGIPTHGNTAFLPLKNSSEMIEAIKKIIADGRFQLQWQLEQQEALLKHFSHSTEHDLLSSIGIKN